MIKKIEKLNVSNVVWTLLKTLNLSVLPMVLPEPRSSSITVVNYKLPPLVSNKKKA
jgi:hypothetical protein